MNYNGKLAKKVIHIAAASGWRAMIGNNPNPILFWAITDENVVHAVIQSGTRTLEFADEHSDFLGYSPNPKL